MLYKSAGDNCTHTHTHKGSPIIGDNVHISAGAIVVGNIIVGNNSMIGAGVTVVKDVVVINAPACYYLKSDKSKRYKL